MRPAFMRNRRARLWCSFATLCLIVAMGVYLSGVWVRVVGPKCFDKRITPRLIASVCGKDVPFSFSSVRRWTEVEYRVLFTFKTDDPEISASITIVVAPAGRYLKPSEYEREKAKTIESDRKEPPEMRWTPDLFPEIGRRARVGLALGPGGGGDTTIFTTSDGWFDVSVSQSNRLKEGIAVPDLDMRKLTRMISDLYDKGA